MQTARERGQLFNALGSRLRGNDGTYTFITATERTFR
jgi:hypothetical protein